MHFMPEFFLLVSLCVAHVVTLRSVGIHVIWNVQVEPVGPDGRSLGAAQYVRSGLLGFTGPVWFPSNNVPLCYFRMA